MSKKELYRVVFMSQGQVYEIYAREVGHGEMFVFIEVEQLVFGLPLGLKAHEPLGIDRRVPSPIRPPDLGTSQPTVSLWERGQPAPGEEARRTMEALFA